MAVVSRFGTIALAAALAGCAGIAPGAPPSSTAVRMASEPATVASRVLLDEEFAGSSLDTKRWYTCYPYARRGQGCTNNPGLELESYRARNVSVGNGRAELVARTARAHAYLPYTSGMISTGGTPHEPATFSYRYGYAEARIKLPHGRGMWPAFWLIPADRTWPPEIDIMEWQGVTPQDDIVTIHWGTAKHPRSDGTTVHTGVNLAGGFHTYGLDWRPDRVVWYFDGRPVKTYTDRAHVPHVPMYVIVNLAIGGWLPGQLQPSPKSFPATMSVDYVRVWSKKPAFIPGA